MLGGYLQQSEVVVNVLECLVIVRLPYLRVVLLVCFGHLFSVTRDNLFSLDMNCRLFDTCRKTHVCLMR